MFEIAQAGDKAYFFRLTAPDGTVVAVSPLFSTIKGAAAGITAVRENAATGLVVDRSGATKRPATTRPAAVAPVALAPAALAPAALAGSAAKAS
ncbi:YegP family protein [Arthrobacter sp. PM3]|uniref:YegP family protein n=1 Tax=Arthrobacter sp. PM3 TaxID=2017685 RepID=UPI000E10DA6D|nr:YegP family protein [Arthrobacter sp. PM3]AXJ08524.1 hypothetical protein CFN17_01935 [Arthrobacter sp. PM3]